MKFWTEKEISFLKENYGALTALEIARQLRRTRASVKAQAKKLSLKTTRFKWTAECCDYMRKHYANVSSQRVADALGTSLKSVYAQAKLMGIKKSETFLRSPESGVFIKGSVTGREHRFRKGVPSWNKGKKFPGRGSATSFKKGHKPHNTKYDNAIVSRKMNGGFTYQYIRVSESHWELLHRYVWEKANGPIPEGHIVVFRDGNQLDCRIENLELITLQENMKRNNKNNLPPELQEIVYLKGRITRKTNQLKDGKE